MNHFQSEGSVFMLQCFIMLAAVWFWYYIITRWLNTYRKRKVREQYDHGYIFAMQSLRAEVYTEDQLLNMATGPHVTAFERGIRDGVHSYQGHTNLNTTLRDALFVIRNKE